MNGTELYFCFRSRKISKNPNVQLSYIFPRSWVHWGRSHSLLILILPALSIRSNIRVGKFDWVVYQPNLEYRVRKLDMSATEHTGPQLPISRVNLQRGRPCLWMSTHRHHMWGHNKNKTLRTLILFLKQDGCRWGGLFCVPKTRTFHLTILCMCSTQERWPNLHPSTSTFIFINKTAKVLIKSHIISRVMLFHGQLIRLFFT